MPKPMPPRNAFTREIDAAGRAPLGTITHHYARSHIWHAGCARAHRADKNARLARLCAANARAALEYLARPRPAPHTTPEARHAA